MRREALRNYSSCPLLYFLIFSDTSKECLNSPTKHGSICSLGHKSILNPKFILNLNRYLLSPARYLRPYSQGALLTTQKMLLSSLFEAASALKRVGSVHKYASKVNTNEGLHSLTNAPSRSFPFLGFGYSSSQSHFHTFTTATAR